MHATGQSGGPDLILRVEDANGDAHEAFVADGLTLGRSEGNDIRLTIQEDVVKRIHARVEANAGNAPLLKCIDPGATLLVDGVLHTQLILNAGAACSIDAAQLRCIEYRPPSRAPIAPLGECPLCGTPTGRALWESVRFCPSCNASILAVPNASDDSRPLLLPGHYGDFVAEEVVARGRMGIFLRGRCRSDMGAPVAIKLLLPSGGPEQRSGHGATSMERVVHPNVVRLYGHGVSGRFSYLALQWVGGGTLQQVVSTARRYESYSPFSEALRWIHDAAKGLAAVHSAGLIHRQIKPSNILLGEDGRALLADFGATRAIDLIGDPHHAVADGPDAADYLAPEQLSPGEPIDCRADLYSLGVTFYEILTNALHSGEYVPIWEFNRSVPFRFNELMQKLLAPKPDDRFQDAQHLLAVLSMFLRSGSEWDDQIRSEMIHAPKAALPRPLEGINRAPGPGTRTQKLYRGLTSASASRIGIHGLARALKMAPEAVEEAFRDIGITIDPNRFRTPPEQVKALLLYLGPFNEDTTEPG